MCTIHLRVHCPDKFSELYVCDQEHTELTVESIVGTALLEVFDTVHVENVTVITPQNAPMGIKSGGNSGYESPWR